MRIILILFLFCFRFLSIKTGRARKADEPINGGFPCSTEEYNFMVIISKVTQSEPMKRTCGGSLLSPYHVLTAASCLGPFRLLVIAGINDPTGVPELRNVVEQVPHLHYNKREIKNDIAVLRIDEPIKRSKHIDYATLPRQAYKGDFLQQMCRESLALSFGHSKYRPEGADLPDIITLECSVLPLIYFKQCEIMSRFTKVSEYNVCTLSLECQGDQGGPIVCGGLEVVAVLNWKSGCDNHFLEVHTRVDQNLDFVRMFLQKGKRSLMDGGAVVYSGNKWFYLNIFSVSCMFSRFLIHV